MRVALTLQVALATAIGGLVAGLGSVWVALSTYEVSSAVAFRAVLVLAVLLAGPYLLVRRRVLAATRRSLVAAGVTGLALGFALNPFAWSGRGFFAQLLIEPGAVTVALDLVAWIALGSLGSLGVLAASRSASESPETLGYRA